MSDDERHAVLHFVAMSGDRCFLAFFAVSRDRHVVSHYFAMSGNERPFSVSHFVADR